MNKGEMTKEIAQRIGVTQRAAGEMLDAFQAIVTETVAKKEVVSLAGFGLTSEMRRK